MTQVIFTILSSSVKFAMTFPFVVLQFNFSLAETVLWTNLGGALGIFFFAFLSDKIIQWWQRKFGKRKKASSIKNRKKPVFTKRNRRIILIKQRYGLIGIAFITPLLLSIPVGAFLVVRYYNRSRYKFVALMASNLLWSVIYTLFYTFWEGVFIK